jgi:hypothetical protein
MKLFEREKEINSCKRLRMEAGVKEQLEVVSVHMLTI